MGSLSLSDALSLCLLLERENDPRSERAFKRWVRRMQLECGLRREEVELLRAAAGAWYLSTRTYVRSPPRGLARPSGGIPGGVRWAAPRLRLQPGWPSDPRGGLATPRRPTVSVCSGSRTQDAGSSRTFARCVAGLAEPFSAGRLTAFACRTARSRVVVALLLSSLVIDL
jgi:hypothetical protein